MPKSILTIHASLTRASTSVGLAELKTRDRKYGFRTIGYHYVITRDGQTEMGRKETDASMHDAVGDSKRTISVCLVGGMGEDGSPENNFTDPQIAGLRDLIADLNTRHNIQEVHTSTPSLTDKDVEHLLS